MRNAFRILFAGVLLACLLPLASCEREEVPSYVGTWLYASSEPDLGPAYAGSYVTVDKKWNYTYYDAPSGRLVSGEASDFTHDGLVITLTSQTEDGPVTYVAELQYLKEDKMIVQTESVNGTPTRIVFVREPGSF